MKLWQELDKFCLLPSCICTLKCSYNLLHTIKSYKKSDYVIRFLKGLNEKYNAVRSQIMLMGPLPNINKAFSLLIQQERKFSTPSMLGHKYFLTVVNDHNRYSWVYLMRLKSKISNHVKLFINFIQSQFNKIVKTIRTDNGPEFSLKDFYATKGIQHHISCVDTPQQNGIVERNHQHLLNVSRSLLFHSHLP